MRVAVIVSGQLRTFSQCCASLAQLRACHDADVFAVLNTDGSSVEEVANAIAILRPRAHRRTHTARLASRVCDWPLPQRSHVRRDVQIGAARARVDFRVTDDGRVSYCRVHAARADETASLVARRVPLARRLVTRVGVQYAQVHRAYSLLHDALRRGARYDAVLRWRPDAMFDPRALPTPVRNEFYVRGAYVAPGHAFVGVNDDFWWHHADATHVIARFYRALPSIVASSPMPWASHVEHWLATFLFHHRARLRVRVLPKAAQAHVVRFREQPRATTSPEEHVPGNTTRMCRA